jgi:hypothetical protein
MAEMETQSEVKQSFKLLVLASMLTVALWFIPFAGALTYPIRLFVTFIHETGHALAALATFGKVLSITLDWNESGLTLAQGGLGFFFLSAGYLGTIVYGSALLLLLRRQSNARKVAIATAVLTLLVTIFYGGNLLAWLTGGIFSGLFLWLGLKAKPKVTHFFMSFIAVQCLLNAVFHLRTLLFISSADLGIANDAEFMAKATGIPSIFWALLWSALSLVIMSLTLVVYYRSLRKREKVIESPDALLIPDYSSKTAEHHS